ncbi:E3 ubiquitin-protein ligase Hakai [Quillaja saponaria]|uniref:RING-type E3 ubiquitin transferase n=1 Tax=Quillaja saponaria TaxID=32244 RepID=A0AAD7L2D5_QUISA|nr:E3 ubiquitin-protein ligase Hakai [Quillaja saponaria]
MLQIRLSKVQPSESSGGVKPLSVETVTVACPDHLVLADLPVANGIGAATAASLVKTVGRRSRRQLGERVHFCVCCDLPISIYGRLSPCEHAFCLDCARSDSICYLCDERIQKIQTIKMMEGIFICAAPHCLKSFLKGTEFESHVQDSHANLLRPNTEKEDGNESEAQSVRQSTASDSIVRGPPRPIFSPGSHSQLQDHEDNNRQQQTREQTPSRPTIQPRPPFFGHVQNYSLDPQLGSSGGRQQGVAPEAPFPEYPSMHPVQPPNFPMPVNSNPMLNPPLPFGYPPHPIEGVQPFYAAPYEMTRQDSASELGKEQCSLLGIPQSPASSTNYSATYPQSWNSGSTGVPFEHNLGGHGIGDGFANPSESQGRVMFHQGDYGRNPGGMPPNPPPSSLVNKGMEQAESSTMDPRDAKGILAPPPPPQQKFNSSDFARDGQGFGWQHDNRDTFGSGQD